MLQQRSVYRCAAVHNETLRVGTGSRVRIRCRVLDVQCGTVIPDDTCVGPEESLVTVGITVADAVQADGGWLQSGDVSNQVHIVTADIGERIGVLHRAPVLEIRMPIVP